MAASDFIWPIFVIEGENRTEPVASMPGVERMTIDIAVQRVEEAAKLGVPCVALFPNIDASLRTEDCAEAFNPDNLGQSDLPRDPRDQGGGAGDRRDGGCRARSL